MRLPAAALRASLLAAMLAGSCGPRDPFALPAGTLVVMLLVVPLLICLLLGLFAFGRVTPLVFRCRRCDRTFRQPPHRAFPRACPHCGDADWNRATATARDGPER